jgi:benzoyl-CoA reductase/2-hydroxyglutaryl-CoA dehydratase subunit BcrC/BadD/HgdB
MLNTLQTYYQNRWDFSRLGKEWKDKGGKIIGCAYPHCPEEIILAAGCLPVVMSGDPDSSTELADKHMEHFFTPDTRYLYQAILAGRYSFLDLICIPSVTNSLARMYYYLFEEKRQNPSLPFGEIYLLEYSYTNNWKSSAYNYGRFKAFKEFLEQLTGKKVTNEALSQAIKTTNETRRLLGQIAAMRKAPVPRLSGYEAAQITLASMLTPKESLNQMLAQTVAQIDNSTPKDEGKVRLFLSGSPVNNLQLYQLIESTEAIVVGEDHAFGNRYFDTLINEEVEPLLALAERYTYKAPEPFIFGLNNVIKYRVDAALEAKADGVIFHQLQWDDTIGWDWPDQQKELEKHGIKTLALDFQDYRISAPERLKLRIQAFVESIMTAK